MKRDQPFRAPGHDDIKSVFASLLPDTLARRNETLLGIAAHGVPRRTRRRSTADLPAVPAQWNERTEAVTEALTSRYGHTRAWQLAEQQSKRIGQLLEDGH